MCNAIAPCFLARGGAAPAPGPLARLGFGEPAEVLCGAKSARAPPAHPSTPAAANVRCAPARPPDAFSVPGGRQNGPETRRGAGPAARDLGRGLRRKTPAFNSPNRRRSREKPPAHALFAALTRRQPRRSRHPRPPREPEGGRRATSGHSTRRRSGATRARRCAPSPREGAA